MDLGGWRCGNSQWKQIRRKNTISNNSNSESRFSCKINVRNKYKHWQKIIGLMRVR